MDRFNNNIAGSDDMELGSPIPPTTLPGSDGLFSVLFRNRWLIIACTIPLLALGFVYLEYSTPIFTSTSLVCVEQNGPQIVDENVGTTNRSTNYLYTQVELFKSTPVLTAVAGHPEIKEMKMFENIEGSLIGSIKRNLNIRVGKKDDIIRVSFDSPYPEEAMQLANSVVDEYIAYSSKMKQGTTSEVLSILQKDNVRREQELDDKLREMFEFRQKHTVAVSSNYDSRHVLETISSHQSQLTNLYASNLTEKHPSIVATKKQIKQLKEQNEANAQYAILQADCEQIRERCNILDGRIKEISAIEDAGALNISIVEMGRVPSSPSKPQKAGVLAIAVALGLTLGGSLALIRNATNQKIHSVEDIDALFNIPVLGAVPSVFRRGNISHRGQEVHLKSNSFGAEVYRTIRTAIFFGTQRDGKKAQTVLITSPAIGEGKSTITSNLAIAMAQADQKTLILDADLRRHNQDNIFRIPNKIGLTSVLAGKASLEKAIQSTKINGLDILVAGPIAPNPSEILSSPKFAQILKDLSTKYERIIIDSPPITPVTDSHILSALCDITLLVLRLESSTLKTVKHARDTLISVGANLLGVVANNVTRRSSGYGKGYGYVYGKQNRKLKIAN